MTRVGIFSDVNKHIIFVRVEYELCRRLARRAYSNLASIPYHVIEAWMLAANIAERVHAEICYHSAKSALVKMRTTLSLA